MFAMVGTRPDISYAIGIVSKYSQSPKRIHCTVVRRIMRYLKGTATYQLYFSSTDGVNKLFAYSDANYAMDIDDRKSRSGCHVLFNNGPITWLSRKQTCTSSSITESEYIDASLTTKEVVWLCRTRDLEIPQHIPTLLFYDNQAAIRMVKNPEFHKRTKHVEVQFHFLREFQSNHKILITYVPSQDQYVDIMTKPFPTEKFQRFRILFVLFQVLNEWEYWNIEGLG